MKKILAVILIVSSVLFTSPASALAIIELPFGGYVTAPLFCTCSFNWWILYAPFYPLPAPPVAALVYTQYASIPYAYQTSLIPVPLPTSWQLGKYIPGPQVCFIGIIPACVPVPALGVITRVGASFPGFTP